MSHMSPSHCHCWVLPNLETPFENSSHIVLLFIGCIATAATFREELKSATNLFMPESLFRSYALNCLASRMARRQVWLPHLVDAFCVQSSCMDLVLDACRVEYFGQKLDGFCFTEHGWVQSYGSRYVRPPVIYGDVKRQSAMTVKEFKYAQDLTKRPVKGMLTGPVTILNWSFPRKDITRQAQAFQIALALREEVADLESAGCRVIQVTWQTFSPRLTATKISLLHPQAICICLTRASTAAIMLALPCLPQCKG